MKTHSRILSILLALYLCVAALLTPASALPSIDTDGLTVILYSANVRGDVDVYPKMANLKAACQSYGLNVILADVGNYLQGSVYAAADCGETVVALMDKAGYDVAAIGSHEFDWNNSSTGTVNHGDFVQHKNLFELADTAAVQMISSNVTRNGTTAFAPTAVVTTASGVTVGFVAATGVDSSRVFPDNCEIFNTLTFNNSAALERAKSGLRVDVVVTLSNSGTMSGSKVIDVAASDTASAGYIVLDKAGNEILRDKIMLDELLGDKALEAEVEAIKLANKDAQYAKSSVKLSGQNQAACKGETNLGDLWTDALRWFAVEGGIASYYDQDDITAGNTGIAVDADHVVALWNGGNLKADLNPGTLTDTELKAVLPYPNKVAVVYMTGAQLTEALEAASQGLPFAPSTASACNSFMQVSGLTYTVDAYKPYDAGDAYGANWHKANSLSRVTITSVNGKAFDPAAVYAVITSNANYNGMDSSYIFKEAVEADSRSTITTIAVRDAVWMYIKKALGGAIGSEYTASQNRITVHGYPFTDVTPADDCSEVAWFMYANGYMDGIAPDTFAPNAIATRAQAITVLWRMAGEPVVNYAMNYKDVAPDQWYSEAIRWATSVGIVEGYGNGSFGPKDPVTLEQLGLILSRCTKTDIVMDSKAPATRAQMAQLFMTCAID